MLPLPKTITVNYPLSATFSNCNKPFRLATANCNKNWLTIEKQKKKGLFLTAIPKFG